MYMEIPETHTTLNAVQWAHAKSQYGEVLVGTEQRQHSVGSHSSGNTPPKGRQGVPRPTNPTTIQSTKPRDISINGIKCRASPLTGTPASSVWTLCDKRH
eukprot:GHVO01023417.1.p1 GENE.GHVO01023417.1~~GHVO01023417.1.p1  ORF type:complete len:100 (-),score=3.80 GHVO01023417.1:160-459(-)